MPGVPDVFAHDHCGTELRFGRGAVDRLSEMLSDRGLDRALVVTGTNVGSNPAVMDPVRAGLGERLAGVFDQTTPAKRAGTAFAGIDCMHAADVDVLVGVGGGSSLDIARQMSAFESDGRSLEAYKSEAREGALEPPSVTDPTPVVVIPTTFAGAAVSSGGSIELLSVRESPTADPIRTSGSVRPIAVIEDPTLYETTPMGALVGSAMNGFNKGLETIYANGATAITDATAVRGLRLLTDALPRLPGDSVDMDHAVAGSLLVQFERTPNVIHAFGHGFARRYAVQQGVAHAIMAPHVLRYLFERVDARRSVLAEGLGLEADAMTSDDLGKAIVASVVSVRDHLGLPDRLRDLEAVAEADLPAIARFVHDDAPMARAPSGLDPTVGELEAVLRAAW